MPWSVFQGLGFGDALEGGPEHGHGVRERRAALISEAFLMSEVGVLLQGHVALEGW